MMQCDYDCLNSKDVEGEDEFIEESRSLKTIIVRLTKVRWYKDKSQHFRNPFKTVQIKTWTTKPFLGPENLFDHGPRY